MSIKELLVTFVTSEEASIAQRSFFNVGAVLTVVVLVAMVIVGLTSQPAWAQVCCDVGCCNSTCGDWSYESPVCGGPCVRYYRSCFTGCVEQYYTCSGSNDHLCECP